MWGWLKKHVYGLDLFSELRVRSFIRANRHILQSSSYLSFRPSSTVVVGELSGYYAKFGCDLSSSHPWLGRSRRDARFHFFSAVRLKQPPSLPWYMTFRVKKFELNSCGWLTFWRHDNNSESALDSFEKVKNNVENVKLDLEELLAIARDIDSGRLKLTEKIRKAAPKELRSAVLSAIFLLLLLVCVIWINAIVKGN